MTKVIAIYNAKGGVGSTLLAAAHCILSARAGIRVTGASLDHNRDLRPWLARHGIPWVDATAKLPHGEDLIVLDVRSNTDLVDALRPNLWVVPMDNRTAHENAVSVAVKLHGPAVWVWNNVADPEYAIGQRVPEQLATRVTFADPIILRDDAIAAAADRFELACTECSGEAVRLLEALVRSNLTRVGLTFDGSSYPTWRGTGPSTETPAEVSAYLHSQRSREHQARERLEEFFAAR